MFPNSGLILGLLAGCHGAADDGVDPTDLGASETSHTGATEDSSPEPTGEITALCTVQDDNALRVDCVVTTPVDEAATISFGGRQLHSDGGTTHAFTLWGLYADTDYPWTASSDSGSTTGSFRTGIPDLPIAATATGTSSASHLLFAVDDAVIVAEPDGRVIWYQRVDLVGGLGTLQGVTAYDFSEDDGLVVLHVDGRRIQAFTLEGVEVLRLDRGIDYDDVPVHHDLYAAAGRFHTLFAERVTLGNTDFVLDGVLTFATDGTLIDTWHHADHLQEPPVGGVGFGGFWAQEFPGASEWGHANSVFATEDEDLVVSLRVLDRAYRIASPSRPDAGSVLWSLSGSGGGDFTLDSAPGVTVDADFIGQHHVRLDADGTVTLFDNRQGTAARTVALQLDEGAGTATITEVHELDLSCSIHGANYILPNGNVLATCATRGLAAEYAGGSDADADPLWTLTVTGGQINRFIPVDLPL